uniref:Truncated envelope polyprotein n=1 Tax=Mus musculus TaxID=10090 RepID=Q811N2_MOUSE|nr:truncated envelope polyprotein [Mus musculus]
MEGPAFSKPLKDKINPWAPLIVLEILIRAGVSVPHDSPHQVFNVTWRVTNLMTGQTANATSLLGTMTDAFPKLYFDLCDLIGDDWDETGLGCRTPGGRKRARTFDFYVCPGHTVPTGCGGPREGYCGKWGCETTGQAYWKPSSSWDLISLKRGNTPRNQGPCYDSSAVSSGIQGATPGGRCNPLVLEFTDAGKKASWDGPKVWGLRLYRSTGTDPVTRFSLTRQVLNIGPRIPIGPNPVITDQLPPSRPVQIMLPRPPQPSPTGAASIQPGTGDRLLNLVDGAYQALNLTSPDKTQECWLCLVSGPPYYEGVAVLGTYSNHTSAPANCSVASQHKLTLSEVTGQGLCVGAVPKTHQALCNTTQNTSDGSYYLAAPAGTIWACNTGLTPCL